MNAKTKNIISILLTLLIIAGAAIWIISRFVHWGNVEFTDNAQVEQQIVPVNSRVQGYIKEIRFKEFERVSKGDTLVVIDDSDLRLNVAKANAEYQNALAGKNITDKTVSSASANLGVSEASIEEARVFMEQSYRDFQRYQTLLDQEAVTRQQFDNAKADYEAKKARYETLERQRRAASSVVDVSRSQLTSSDAGIDLAKAMLETAELNLSYTVITAPCDGYTSRKAIQVGQLVQPGQTLLDLVDTSDVWVNANYKETQLKHIQPGNVVEITVDAIPNVKFEGVVKSISTATGAALSILPQDNSAGNFVKVRQRIPIRIDFTKNNSPEEIGLLRAGMNVECLVKYRVNE
ncbi:MAG: HlyD family secretion protein [Muribaculaceae bacterium]|nr:HlyD family secretion protein [Muribaculaceae bacterium]